MRLVLAMPPSLHRRDLRKAYAQGLRLALRGKTLPYRVYRVRVTFFGRFWDDSGALLESAPDGDNLWKTLADEIARAAGWPRNNDVVLQRDFHVKCVQCEKAYAVVELT